VTQTASVVSSHQRSVALDSIAAWDCCDAGAVIKVDCGEFQHSHEIAKLIGSPPGYLGHRETIPLITQEELEIGFGRE
jgi:hypothetical protein